MKTILVPVDFSDNSKSALDYAILLAKKLSMELTLLHVFQSSMAELSDAEKELELWKAAVISSEGSLKCKTILVEKGDLTEEIIKLINNNTADLVVMGTKGITGLAEVFLGSNTARVIERASCPVIAIPQDYLFTEIKKIVFATNYHDSDVPSIRFMVKLSKLFDAELIVVHVADGERKLKLEEDLSTYFMEQVKKSVTYDKMRFQLLKDDNVENALYEFINKQRADLLAISSEDRMFTGLLLNKSLTRKFVHHIQIPLFAFQAYDIGENDLF